jgi:hypothetical protein
MRLLPCSREHECIDPRVPKHLLVARSAHAPHADGSVRLKLGVLADDP